MRRTAFCVFTWTDTIKWTKYNMLEEFWVRQHQQKAKWATIFCVGTIFKSEPLSSSSRSNKECRCWLTQKRTKCWSNSAGKYHWRTWMGEVLCRDCSPDWLPYNRNGQLGTQTKRMSCQEISNSQWILEGTWGAVPHWSSSNSEGGGWVGGGGDGQTDRSECEWDGKLINLRLKSGLSAGTPQSDCRNLWSFLHCTGDRIMKAGCKSESLLSRKECLKPSRVDLKG